MAKPQDITRQATDIVVPLTWAELGAATEPAAGKKDTGWLANGIVDSAELNWLDRQPQRWLRALFSRYPQASEGLMSSWLVRNGVWADGINPLEGFTSDTGKLDPLAADVWLDPDETGDAVRLQVYVSKASPHLFPANQDTYIFAPIDVIDPPSVSDADLTYISVAVGNPAPTSLAKVGPDNTATAQSAPSVSAATWCGSLPVCSSKPFVAQQTRASAPSNGRIAISVLRRP